MALFMAFSMNAQITTSSISGNVVDDKNEPLIGATVLAKHMPSGTTYGAATNLDGRFAIQGMRVGGPYTITITYIGFKEAVYNNVSLTLGEELDLSTKMVASTNNLEEVVVTGQRTHGAGGNFNNQQIQITPTIDRNIYDVVKLNPMAQISKYGGLSIAGANNRYNSFQIDGTVSNDVFGLAGSGTNGGQTSANPISLDAIEQIQVAVAPYDVRQSGFTGGAINAITKSGSNEFHGSAYGFYNNQGMYGKYNSKGEKSPLSKQYDETFGATLGGRIIKDKLFFFTSVEYKKNSYPNSYYSGMDNYFSKSELDAIQQKYEAKTGFKEGQEKQDVVTQSLGFLARLDWNINNRNKFTVRYQYAGASQNKAQPVDKTYYFNNSGYKQTNRTHSLVAELHSQIGDNMNNEARVAYTRVRDWRDAPYQGPTVYINNVAYGSKTNGSVNIGTEYSSGVNSLDQDIFTFEDNFSLTLGKHNLTFGTHEEIYSMYNGFIQYANGEYVYNSVNDFLNDVVNKYYYNYSDVSITGTSRWRANVKAGQFGFYAQDKWQPSNRFELTYGVRLDMPTFFNKPTANPDFNNSSFASKFNVKVGEVPSVKAMISPRVGFRWNLTEDKSTVLRGGTGLFTGRVPFVWLSNVYTNTGMEQKSVTITGANLTADQRDIANWENLMKAIQAGQGAAGKATINTVDKKFKYPQTWRTNLALEQKLPWDMKLTLEGLFSLNLNAVYFENLALELTNTPRYAVAGVSASQVPYYSTDAGAYQNIINLRSINKGYSYSFTAKLEKSFNFGLDLMASYTFGHSKAVNDGLSSVALSNWNNYTSVDVNKPVLSYSMFDIPNRIQVTALYNSKRYANGFLNTEVAVTYNGSNGMRYSLSYSENTGNGSNNNKSFNGDGRTGHTLMYIPTDAELAKMQFTKEEDRAKFGEWIAKDAYAKNHRGQFAERFGSQAPFESHVDLHFAENFYYNKKGGKISISLDITNFANLLNKKWGTYYSSTTGLQMLKVDKVTPEGVGVFSFTNNELQKNDIYSRWHMQLGLKVTF